MRLVARLAAYLLIPIGLVFALDTFLTVRSDLNLLDLDMRHDDELLARTLAVPVEQAWREGGEAAAASLVSRFPSAATGIASRLVELDAPEGSALAPAQPDVAASLGDAGALAQLRTRHGTGLRLLTYLRLDTGGSRPVALEIAEPISHERNHLASRIPHKLATAGAMVLLCAGVAWAMGVRVVGRPIDALIEKARRVGRGDLSAPLALASRDELSALAREMNAMADLIAAARHRTEEESRARIAAVEQLRHADRLTTVGRLASGLAHELGTPLNIVSGRAQMIANGETTGPDEIERAARVIGDQADRMTRIVRQLLDFARHRSGTTAPTDLAEIALETITFLQPLARKRKVELTCRADPVRVRADAAQIQQAVANLVMNAIQASRADGVVEVRVELRRVAAPPDPGCAPGPYAALEVEDRGEGIPAESLPAIFDPFFTTKPVGEGTGLGLAIVYGILREHGGWIEVRSEPGRGSCFSAFLPAEGGGWSAES